MTPEILSVLDAVFNRHGHFTPEDLEREAGPGMAGDELQDLLGEMVNAGLIRRVHLGEDRIQYEHVYEHAHHDHMICVECGRIVEFQDEEIERLQRRMADHHRFRMLGHSLQIRGLCEECQGKETEYRPEFVHYPRDGDAHDQMPLTMVSSGEKVEVAVIQGGVRMRERLASMGLMERDRVEVLVNEFAGPIILKSRGARLAIGHGMAHHILVRQLDENGGRSNDDG